MAIYIYVSVKVYMDREKENRQNKPKIKKKNVIFKNKKKIKQSREKAVYFKVFE